MAVEATRWVMEKVERANNVSKFYIIYVTPYLDHFVEVRHWGRRGQAGRNEPFTHDTLQAALDSARTKAFAELGKGYKEIAHDSFPFNPQANGVNTTALERAAKTHAKNNADLGLTNSEVDRFTRDAQTLLVSLQDPQTGIDIDRVAQIKTAWHDMETQFGRASATMKMIDMLCAARLSQKVGAGV